ITTACVISIGNCTALTTLNAFNQLNAIVPFGQNNQGRETNQTLGGWSPILWIHSTALTNLNNFSSLTNFNGFMLALDNNNSLTDLSGLSNVLPSSVGLLRLNSNDNLANCAVQVVCNIIDLATAQIFITNNASSCESESAVQTACAALSSIEFDLESKIAIYPNPFQSQITFELGNSYENVTIVINDITGKQLYQNSFSGNQLVINNLGNLPSGIYVATLTTENGTSITKKLIK
ncbi:MAG: T9SS type A sorting domain-containing protein, partial [Flavobacterium sp.]|nr:T9SS type A sorting domain-containing protein [Flavobacterium sp.]